MILENKTNFIQLFLSKISKDIQIKVVDVGAMGGVPRYWRLLGGYVHVVAFEPDEREFMRLRSTDNISYLPYALYDRSQSLSFYIAKEAGKSSVYRPNMELMKDFMNAERMETIHTDVISADKVKTLDEALAISAHGEIDVIKLDTQGSELDILKGGKKALAQNFCIEVEVEFVQLYTGQPLFRDIDVFLDAHGFQLVDLRRVFWKRKNFFNYIGRGQLVFADALYLKRDDVFLDSLMNVEHSLRQAKIAKAIAICMVYKLPDIAIALIDKAYACRYINEDDHRLWHRTIVHEAQSWGLSWLPGYDFIAKIARRLAEELKFRSHLGWSDGDRHVGNIRNE